MKKISIFLLVFLLSSFHNSFPLFQQVQGLESTQIKRVSISLLNPELIYVASRNALYRSQDSGETFQKIAVFKDQEIQHIFFDPYLANTLYVAGSRHFYRMINDLEKLFSAPSEQIIYTAAKHRGRFFVGTSKGLYYAREDTLIWKKLKTLSNFSIYDIEPQGEDIYLATERGIYVFSSKNRVQRLFVMREQEEEAEQTGLEARVIIADVFKKDTLWLGTNRGLFVSYNKGLNWKKLYIPGIDNLYINCIIQTKLQKDAVYLGTNKGFFVVDVDKNTAREIFEGLYSAYINWIEFTVKGKIYLATPKGLFKNTYFTSSRKKDNLELFLSEEPSIGEIQEQALRYNEVHPEKIRKWRNSLKYRALFPTVDLDYYKTIYGTAGTGTYDGKSFVGPRDWSLGFSWDIGDLIWNPSQTSIDVRSRLNTQLRLDILDEINRVYFERLRLKNDIKTNSLSGQELFKNKLRLEELTAIIDGYTGGYFSHKTQELNGQ